MNSPGAADSKGVGDGQGINVDVLLHVVHGRVQGGLHAGRHIRTLVVTRGPDSAEGIWISSTQWSADQKARSGSDGTLFNQSMSRLKSNQWTHWRVINQRTHWWVSGRYSLSLPGWMVEVEPHNVLAPVAGIPTNTPQHPAFRIF